MKKIYLDYAATTPVKKEVLDAMMPHFTEGFGNPSSVYSTGREAKVAVENARDLIANTISAHKNEVFFTAGGSESDNWAIKGMARKLKNTKGKNHIITMTIEHHAVLHTCQTLETEGFDVTYLPVDEYGLISLEELKAAITDKTALISIMYINNEIGTVNDVKAIGQIAKDAGVIFHTDAVQAYGNVKIDVNEMNIDMMSISSHKIYGPKGIGALYIKRGLRPLNIIDGGAQENRRRAGTENVPGIVGFAKAAEIAHANLESHRANLISIRDKAIKDIMEKIPYVRLNGHPTKRHPGNVNVCFEFIEGEGLLLSLDLLGIAGSSGSACTSGSLDPSHVLLGIGLPHEIAHGSLRMSIGDFTSQEDVDYTVDQLVIIVERLRMMSPLYDRVLKANGGK